MSATERSVSARWAGGLRAEVDAGGFEVVSDEPESVGGAGSGPQPTELLLASIASCFTIAVAWTAAKRKVELEGLAVDVTGTYDGPRFRAFRIEVHADSPAGPDLEKLVEAAKRVCYVTRTLAEPPEITFSVT
ncbi:OsmC family protein [Pseudonocardia broussonetiae]|uniref:OsmC family protein n=1 Tax=Pseudonocardia broussonetiae TaxID=2736640 RepID=A0A6M6JDU2_9PSEU|nr:OsmC family protein [Pseudonocardia broussonetiae]QJY46114.1 OsmC family protein [Pseudonocardia broussonetiae]